MWQLFLGAFFISFAPILVKAVDIGPTMIGVYRCGIAASLLLPYSLYIYLKKQRANEVRFDLSPQFLVYLIGAGFTFALDLFVWHRAVIYIGAGLGTLIANTQVFYLAIFGILFIKEPLTWRFGIAVPLAFIGIYLLVGVQQPTWVVSKEYAPGIFYGLSTGVIYAVALICFQKVETLNRKLTTSQKLAAISTITTLFLLVFALLEQRVEVPSGRDFVWLVTLAVSAQIPGWLLIVKSLAKVPISRAGLILLTQPTLAILMGAWIYGEHLSVTQIGGALLTLSAIYLGSTRHVKSRSRATS